MVEIVAPFEGQGSGWPKLPCTLSCNLSALRRVEIRFEPYVGKDSQRTASMRLFRTMDGGGTWEEVPTKLLSFWKRLDLKAFWPPEPMDLQRFRFDETGMEAEITEVAFAFATGGDRRWRLRYDESRKGWEIHEL